MSVSQEDLHTTWTSPSGDDITTITNKIIHEQVINRVSCPTSGAISTFIGTTRDNFEGACSLKSYIILMIHAPI